ncbi:MAG: porphobilinogen synthase [Thermoleophilaceae bacterium]|nr:porphobilinogen synthase [Thermoleophilaceae bacterium]
MAFPATRLRRLRATGGIREMVRETELQARHLIAPQFVLPGEGRSEAVESMPGVMRHTIDRIADEAVELHALGVPAVLLFGVPTQKDDQGSEAWDAEGAVQLAVRAVKSRVPEMTVVTDVCLCAYTDHGHCGVVRNDGQVDNDATLELLTQVAVSHAQAGADAVAPSDMMDGRVGRLRSGLDEAGLSDAAIIAYSAKYASAFYGPFRDAADSTPAFGDRRSYQMDPANAREAVREAQLDVAEGADIVMVKPGLPYLDIVRQVRDAVQVPVAVYNVSGEYSMLKAAVANGYLDERAAVTEALLSMRRAGADLIVSYHAKDFASWTQ